MPKDNCTVAREVHALLLSAHPHAGDTKLAKAAEFASIAIEAISLESSRSQQEALLAVQTPRKAIESKASAATGEHLLLDAVRIAEKWVRAAC